MLLSMEDQLEKYGNNLKHGVQRSPATDSAIRLCLAGTSGEAAYFLSVKPSEKEVPSSYPRGNFSPSSSLQFCKLGRRAGSRPRPRGPQRGRKKWKNVESTWQYWTSGARGGEPTLNGFRCPTLLGSQSLGGVCVG